MISDRVKTLELSGIRKMFELVGSKTINFGIGQPDFQPPPKAIEALGRASKEGWNRYTSTFGLPELREKIAEVYLSRYGNYTGDNVLITIGGSHALYVAVMSLVNPGDEVLIPNPGFVLYSSHVQLAGGIPVEYTLSIENEFRPDIEELKEIISNKTKAIIVNSPGNPTGGVFSKEDVRAISDLAEDYGFYIISDEVYEKFVYDDVHVSFLEYSDRVIYPMSFSKRYSMTGWRIGFLAGPKEFIEHAMKFSYYTIACPPAPIQKALHDIIGDPEVEAYVEKMILEFKKRRDYVYERLIKMPHLSVSKPKGAFYVMPKYDMKIPSQEFSMRLLEEKDVAVSPGSAFGSRGEYHFRISFAASMRDLEEGLNRIEEFLEQF